jgi:flagellar hook-associated protein 1 FlgK
VVRDAGGALLGSLNVGQGYAASDPLIFADGLEVVFGHGTLNAGEQFTVEAIGRSDPTGLLAAAGVNALFSGTGAGNISVSDYIRESSSRVAVALGAQGVDNLNARRMAGVADETIAGLDGARPADAFRNVVSEVGHWVSFRQARREGLQNLLEELQRQRDEASGVDVNEEAANLLVLEQLFQAMARFLGVVNQTEKDLMNLL